MESCKEIIRQKLKKSIIKENIKLMEINIEYPSLNNSANEKSFDKINGFYQKLADSYASYCEKSAENTNLNRFISSASKPMGGVMKYIISLNTSEYLSVVCEISYYDGIFKRQSRIAQTWRCSDGIMLPYTYFFKKEDLNRKKVKKKIGDIISNKIREEHNDFTYTDKGYKKYAYNVDPKNFFLCTNGLAFWFQPGTLAPTAEGFPTYVIPYEKEKSYRNGSSL